VGVTAVQNALTSIVRGLTLALCFCLMPFLSSSPISPEPKPASIQTIPYQRARKLPYADTPYVNTHNKRPKKAFLEPDLSCALVPASARTAIPCARMAAVSSSALQVPPNPPRQLSVTSFGSPHYDARRATNFAVSWARARSSASTRGARSIRVRTRSFSSAPGVALITKHRRGVYGSPPWETCQGDGLLRYRGRGRRVVQEGRVLC
jgi:hypothetical protein